MMIGIRNYQEEFYKLLAVAKQAVESTKEDRISLAAFAVLRSAVDNYKDFDKCPTCYVELEMDDCKSCNRYYYVCPNCEGEW